MDAPRYELLALNGSDEIGRWSLAPGRFTLGRSAECSISLQAEGVADEHAQLSINDDGSIVLEVGLAGASVEGSSVTGAVRVQPDQYIDLGSVSLIVQQSSASQNVSLADAETEHDELPAEFRQPERYEIGAEIAKGGMGAILNARQSTIRRSVAMKVILGRAEEDPWQRLRFIEEAQITGQLEHPNIVPVHDAGLDGQGRVYYTMKLVKGITLKKVLELLKKEEPAAVAKYSLLTLLTIYQKVCDAVAFAHSKGVIHRDLKPENIMIGAYGEVLVMDWGLARLFRKRSAGGPEQPHAPAEEIDSSRFDQGDGYSTMAGSIMGTPAYMAPEQARGELEQLDQRSDLFALGVILYEILTLARAFPGKNGREILADIVSGTPPPAPATFSVKGDQKQGLPRLLHLKQSAVPASLSAVAMRALRYKPEDRYPNVEALQADLTAYQNGFATSAEKAGWFKRASLAVKRNKAASIGASAVLVVGVTFGTKAILEGRRAEREAATAKAALADLKASAPSLLELAGSKAEKQEFSDALRNLDAVIGLDPALASARWQRAWVFMGMEKWREAAEAVRLAQQHDPAATKLAAILPTLKELAATEEAKRWTPERVGAMKEYLQEAGATAALGAFVMKFQGEAELKLQLVKERVAKWLGPKAKFNLIVTKEGLVDLSLNDLPVDTIEPLRGLPIEQLSLKHTNVSDLSPLRGMKLTKLYLSGLTVADLSPLAGMPLHELVLQDVSTQDLSPLRGLPLQYVSLWSVKVPDIDLSFLADSPIEDIIAPYAGISDLSPLRGRALRKLDLRANTIRDLSPLRGAPITELDLRSNPIKDLTPLLDLPNLERIRLKLENNSFLPLRSHPALQSINDLPVAKFWAEYDAQQAAGKK